MLNTSEQLHLLILDLALQAVPRTTLNQSFLKLLALPNRRKLHQQEAF